MVLTISPQVLAAGQSRADSPSTATPQGKVCGKLVEKRTTKYGDTVFRYRIKFGTVEIGQPGPNFDPTKSPDDRIKELKLPTRPKNPQERSVWERRMRATNAHPGAPCVHTGVRADLPQKELSNWSGRYVNNVTAAGVWTAAVGDTIVPQTLTTQCPQSSYTSWVGIGGLNGAPLVQAGAYINNYDNTDPTIHPFWEIVNGAADTGGVVDFANLAVGHGNSLSYQVHVDESPGQGGTNAIWFSVFNNTIWQGASTVFTPDSGDINYYKNLTAELIAERMQVTREGVKKFTSYMYNDDTLFTGGAAKAGVDPNTPFTMFNDIDSGEIAMYSRTILGLPLGDAGPIDSSDFFTAHWLNCGQVEKAD